MTRSRQTPREAAMAQLARMEGLRKQQLEFEETCWMRTLAVRRIAHYDTDRRVVINWNVARTWNW